MTRDEYQNKIEKIANDLADEVNFDDQGNQIANHHWHEFYDHAREIIEEEMINEEWRDEVSKSYWL